MPLRRLLLALVLAAPAAAQPVLVAHSPEPGDERKCTTVGAPRVCAAFTADGNGFDVTVTNGGRETARWRHASPSSLHDIRVFRDGDRLLVATFDTYSNGLGVKHWTLAVLPAGARTPAYSFGVDDFGATGGSFRTRRGRTVLWATEWTDMEDPSGQRRRGTYLVGRPFTLGEAGLVPATDQPIRARRLLFGFERERNHEIGEVRDRLFSRHAETWRTDPLHRGRSTTIRGRVASGSVVQTADQGTALRVGLRTADGQTLTLTQSEYGSANTFSHVGDAATGRLWPEAYRPADIGTWLVGHDARYETRAGEPAGIRWRE